MNSIGRKVSFLTVLFSEFIDYAGVAIAYPLFAYMLFEPTLHFLPAEATNQMRGVWLGILLALYPLFQFISAPIFGKLSDMQGRRRLLCWTRGLATIGYAVAFLATIYQSLALLALYRIVVGIAAGNCSIVSAIVADISTQESKAKNYGLLNMACGAGFTLGPFLGSILFDHVDLSTPFLIAFSFVVINWLLVTWKLKETLTVRRESKISFFSAVYQIKQAVMMKELRFLFLTLLIFSFGWSFLNEFIPIFLIDRYNMAPAAIGWYYGYTGFFYAISAGFLIYPFIRLFKMEQTLGLSMLLSGAYLFIFLFIPQTWQLWFYLPLSQFFLAFAYPLICALISNRVSVERQGEALGIYQAVIALAFAITPLLGGLAVGDHPHLAITISGALMIAAASIHALLKDEIPLLDRD